MVHQCTKLHCERTHHKQVIRTNTIYTNILVVAYKLVNVYILILKMGCICVQSVSLWA